jgi:hypothetical protein
MNQAMQGFQQGLATGGKRPKMRNALMTMLIPYGLIIGANILTNIVVMVLPASLAGILSLVFSLLSLVGSVLALIQIYQMLNEIKSVTKNESFNWWFIFIPIYSIIWLLTTVRQEIGKAKQMVGAPQPVRSGVAYFFLALWAMASDVNDIAARMPPG